MKSLLAILAVSVISVAFGCMQSTAISCEKSADCQVRGWKSCEIQPNATQGICQGLMDNICFDDEFCVKTGFGDRCEKAENETLGSCKHRQIIFPGSLLSNDTNLPYPINDTN